MHIIIFKRIHDISLIQPQTHTHTHTHTCCISHSGTCCNGQECKYLPGPVGAFVCQDPTPLDPTPPEATPLDPTPLEVAPLDPTPREAANAAQVMMKTGTQAASDNNKSPDQKKLSDEKERHTHHSIRVDSSTLTQSPTQESLPAPKWWWSRNRTLTWHNDMISLDCYVNVNLI